MQNVMLDNFIEDLNPRDKEQFIEIIDKIFLIGPFWTTIANIGFAILYFWLCVFVDSKRMTAYKTPDNR
jgi:hypothetical protein